MQSNVSSDEGAIPTNQVSEFKDYVEADEFIPQQVFNYDETGFFWKKMDENLDVYFTGRKDTART